MANAPWEQTGITKEQYAKDISEIEAAANKHDNDPEPMKNHNEQSQLQLLNSKSNQPHKTEANEIELKLPQIGNNDLLTTQLIFHDFDYIDPLS